MTATVFGPIIPKIIYIPRAEWIRGHNSFFQLTWKLENMSEDEL